MSELCKVVDAEADAENVIMYSVCSISCTVELMLVL